MENKIVLSIFIGATMLLSLPTLALNPQTIKITKTRGQIFALNERGSGPYNVIPMKEDVADALEALDDVAGVTCTVRATNSLAEVSGAKKAGDGWSPTPYSRNLLVYFMKCDN